MRPMKGVHGRNVVHGKDLAMSRNLLLESLIGHLALLQARHPRKAASPVARRLKRHLSLSRRDAR